MNRSNTHLMEPEDERQYMLNDNFEIMEKYGVPTGAMQIHFHNFYELLYIAAGEFACLIDNTTYYLKKGDFLLIDRNHMHHYQYVENKHEDSKRVLLWVTKEFLNELSGAGVDLSACFSMEGAPAYHFPAHHEDKLADYLFQILFGVSTKDGIDAEQMLIEKSYLTLFFVYLNRLCARRGFQFQEEETTTNDMMKLVFEHIDSHISDPIIIDELANLTGMTKYQFLRSFKTVTGMTVHDFIIKKRLLHACEEIWKGCPISDVYKSCGFADYSSFFRNFKKAYDMSPREFKVYSEQTV